MAVELKEVGRAFDSALQLNVYIVSQLPFKVRDF